MAVSKVILNGTTLIDTTDKTVTAGSMLDGVTALKNDGTTATGSIASKSSADLTASGATVTAPAGYYAESASKSVASGTAGTPTASKGTVSNHSISVTPSVTNTTGYISGGTKNGTAVTVSASELVSGELSVTENGSFDVTNYADLVVAVAGGGGGLEYEEWEYTPSTSQTMPFSIEFPHTHDTAPFFFAFFNQTTEYSADRWAVVFREIYINWYDLFGITQPHSSSVSHYGRVDQAYCGTTEGASFSTASFSLITNGTASGSTDSRYWCTNESITIFCSTNRACSQGATFKVIAVWKPQT